MDSYPQALHQTVHFEPAIASGDCNPGTFLLLWFGLRAMLRAVAVHPCSAAFLAVAVLCAESTLREVGELPRGHGHRSVLQRGDGGDE